MSTHSEKFRYPYAWGRDVVGKFVEKYARGTYFLSRILDRSPGDIRHGLIVVLCRGNSLRYESIKSLIKTLDREEDGVFRSLTVEDRKLLYKYYLFLAEDFVMDEKSAQRAIDSIKQRRLFL